MWLLGTMAAVALLFILTALQIWRQNRDNRLLQTLQAKTETAKQDLEATLHAIPDFLFELSAEGTCLCCRAPTDDLLFAPRARLLGKNIDAVLPADVARDWREALLQAADSGFVTGRQYSLDLSSGRRWFEYSVSRKRGAAGKEPTFLMLCHDISEWKKTEAELRNSERQFRTLAENSPDPIYRYDRHYRRLYVNQVMSRLTGRPVEQLKAGTLDEPTILTDDQTRRMKQAVEQVFSTGKETSFDLNLSTFHGEQREYQVLAVPEFDDSGQVATVLAIARDTTQLRETERRLTRFIATLPGYAFTYRVIGPYAGCYPFTSPGIEDTVGLKPEDVAASDQALMALINPDDFETMGRVATESFQTLKPYCLECRIRHPVKGERWLESRATPEILSDGTVQWHGISIDITERKRLEEQLVQSERDFRSLVENSPDNIARYDTQLRTVYINPSLEAFLGRTSSELVGEALPNAVEGRVHPQYLAALKRVLSENRPVDATAELTDTRGQTRYHSFRMIPEKDPRGNVKGVLAIGRDITDLLVAQEQFRDVFENAADSLFLLEVTPDQRFRNLAVNPAFERSTGIPSQLLVGKFIEETVPPQEAAKAIAKYRACVEREEAVDLEEEFDLPSGKKTFFSTLVPKKDGWGRIHRIVGITRDITEQRRQEAEIHAKEQEFRTVVENSPDMIIRYDKNLRRVYVNPAFERFNQAAWEQIRDKEVGESGTMLELKDAQVFREKVASVLHSGQGLEFDLTGKTIVGTPFAFAVRIAPEFNQAGSVVSALAMVHDVTELKERNDHLLAISEERRLAEIRSLEAQVNPHFLNNTLNALNWLAIENNQWEISRGLRDLASITRYSISQFNLTATLAEEVQWMRRYLDLQCLRFGKSFEYSVRDEGADPSFRLYKLLFQPLLENAIIHGFDENESGGVLEIRFELSDNRILKTTIRDNGKGFEIDGPPETGKERVSVGMTNLAQRLKAYYGDAAELRYTSQPGAGTTVFVSFPEVRE